MRHIGEELPQVVELNLKEKKERLFPPKGQRAVLRQSNRLGDCYLLASLDYFFGCEEGRGFIENLFTATKEGIVVRLKHTTLSKHLEKHKTALSEKYSYYHDTTTGEDVFLVKDDYLRKIQEHAVGVATETPAIQILEHLIPYYYQGAQAEHMQEALHSVVAHGKPIVRTSTEQKQTEFLAQILGTTTDESMTVDDVIKLKKIAPNFAFYLSIDYRDNRSRHAYVFDGLDENGSLLLRNPHNNAKPEIYTPSYIQARNPRFVHYKINPGQILVLKQLIKIPLDKALQIKHNETLFSFLTTVAKQFGYLDPGVFDLVCQLYERYQSRILSYFDHLDTRSQYAFISGLKTANGNLISWIRHIQAHGVSFRQLQRIELVHQLLESQLLAIPEDAEFNHEHLTCANQDFLIEAFKKLKPSPDFSEERVATLKEKFGEYLSENDLLIQEIRQKITSKKDIAQPTAPLAPLSIPSLPEEKKLHHEDKKEPPRHKVRFNATPKTPPKEPPRDKTPTQQIQPPRVGTAEPIIMPILIFTPIQHEALDQLTMGLTSCLAKLKNTREKKLYQWCAILCQTVETFKNDKNFAAFKNEIQAQLQSNEFKSFAKPHTICEKIYHAVISLFNAFFHWFDFQRPRPDFFSQYPSNRSIQLKREFEAALDVLENIASPSSGNPLRF